VSTEASNAWPEQVFVWKGNDGVLRASEGKPPREFPARSYFRPLPKHELYKRAGLDQGVSIDLYLNNLERIIENQTCEINRLRARNQAESS
jgi:hypothetical protein